MLWRRAEVTEHIFPAAPLEELGDRRGEAGDPQALHDARSRRRARESFAIRDSLHKVERPTRILTKASTPIATCVSASASLPGSGASTEDVQPGASAVASKPAQAVSPGASESSQSSTGAASVS